MLLHLLLPLPDGQHGRLVHQAHDVRSRPSGAPTSNHVPVNVPLDGFVARVHLEDLFSALHSGEGQVQDSVEAARPRERIVQHARAVGRRQHHDALVVLEPVHLREHLVDGVGLLFVAHGPGPGDGEGAGRSDGVKLVNEDDARRLLSRLLKQVAHARRAHAHKHLRELRPRRREEGHLGLARNRLGQQRLARARGTHHQHAGGEARAHVHVAVSVPQVVDELVNLLHHVVDARNVLHRRRHVRQVHLFGQGHGKVVLGLANRAHHELEQERAHHNRGDEPSHPRGNHVPQRHGLDTHLHLVEEQVLKQVRVERQHHSVNQLAVVHLAQRCHHRHAVPAVLHLFDVVHAHHLPELCVAQPRLPNSLLLLLLVLFVLNLVLDLVLNLLLCLRGFGSLGGLGGRGGCGGFDSSRHISGRRGRHLSILGGSGEACDGGKVHACVHGSSGDCGGRGS
mmetsp:Transcript_36633/g.68939  ORF Transcript_36633/g.68939 Transcript_36633/m.68939 type:complete len:453 (+) Transcript_36633:1295-2653(+)